MIRFFSLSIYILFLVAVCGGFASSCKQKKESGWVAYPPAHPGQVHSRDSVFIFDSILVKAPVDMSLHHLKNIDALDPVQPPGDTLYADHQQVILGDANVARVYKRYNPPEFPEYHVEVLTKLVPPNFTTTAFGKDPKFREMITRGCEKGVNFSGHYTMVTVSCGAECVMAFLVDRSNGRIIDKFGLSATNGYYGIEFRKDSRLVIVNSELMNTGYPGFVLYRNYEQPEAYEWNGNQMLRIR